MKATECPQCGEALTERWQTGRMVAQTCIDRAMCGWKGEPYKPTKRPIQSVKTEYLDGIVFELFDRYGHAMRYSETFPTRSAAIKEIERELKYGKTDKDAGPYTAILWPASVKVRGEKFR